MKHSAYISNTVPVNKLIASIGLPEDFLYLLVYVSHCLVLFILNIFGVRFFLSSTHTSLDVRIAKWRLVCFDGRLLDKVILTFDSLTKVKTKFYS